MWSATTAATVDELLNAALLVRKTDLALNGGSMIQQHKCDSSVLLCLHGRVGCPADLQYISGLDYHCLLVQRSNLHVLCYSSVDSRGYTPLNIFADERQDAT